MNDQNEPSNRKPIGPSSVVALMRAERVKRGGSGHPMGSRRRGSARMRKMVFDANKREAEPK